MEDHPRLLSFTIWQRIIRLVLLLLFLWQAWTHIYIVLTGLWGLFRNGLLPTAQFITSFIALAVTFFVLIICYIVYIFWFSQFILPVTGRKERLTAGWRLLLYGVSSGRWHGAAVFVRDGDIDASLDELHKNGPGVAFVDLRSAITLDKNLKHKNDISSTSPGKLQKVHSSQKTNTFSSGIRVAGPGLTFIRKDEKITGAVDLRKQTRSRKSVQADTRDGIRVTTDVSCTFTIGQPPEVIDVCLGDEKSGQVLVIEWESSQPVVSKKIKSLLPNQLDSGDEREIRAFIASYPDPSKISTDVPEEHFPYTLNEKRVEKAVYSQTLIQDPAGTQAQAFKKWCDWPQDVAAEKFRILLAKWPYMKLYSPEDEENYPLKDFKKELSRQVRNTGILAYRVVALRNGDRPEEGKGYSNHDLIYYPARELVRLDVLRYRGIRVLSTSIGELEPKEKTVRDHLMNSWLSAKQKDADVKVADYNLEIARIRNQARVKTQRNMIYNLTQLLENQEYPREALALLIYQELEATAANPETRKLLPEDTMSMLNGIGTILLQRNTNTKPTSGTPVILPGEKEH